MSRAFTLYPQIFRCLLLLSFYIYLYCLKNVRDGYPWPPVKDFQTLTTERGPREIHCRTISAS